MNRVHLNGADAEEIAKIMGGVLIAVNGDVAMIAGGDITKLEVK